jgi:hypothetical protein
MNIKFDYLYRDGANYKNYNSEVFSNKEGLSIKEVEDAIESCLIEGVWFYANKWGLKDLHYFAWDEEIDHSWHEYDCIEVTEETATKGDISDFVRLLRASQ